MDPFQYSDIPQIPIFGEEQSYYQPVQDLHYSQYGGQDFTGRLSGFQGDPMDYNDFGSQGALDMQPMQRFLHGMDPAPFASGLLHANMDKSMHLQAQAPRPFERSWPFPEYVPHGSRNVSPDRTSANSSLASQNELRSPHPAHAASYGSPVDFSQASMPYPTSDSFNNKAYSAELPLPGNSINLRALEIHHEEAEPAAEEHDHVSSPSQFEDEQEPVYTKTEAVSESYNNYSDTVTVANNVRDAESVQPMTQSDDDSDYAPGKNSKRRRSSTSSRGSGPKTQRRGGRGRKSSNASTHSTSNRVGKRGGRGSNASINVAKASNGSNGHDADARPFPCPLAGYGCNSTFSSKNEWKRHVGTQHIKLGFWRCDLCTTHVDPNDERSIYHNDFNRKDLFTQHLRRMHAAPLGGGGRRGAQYPVTEENLVEHQNRCYQILRSTPTQSSCLFCDRAFTGPNSWEERMEHVGRHLEKDRQKISLHCADWNTDKDLEQYLLNEGLIEQERSGEFKIGNGKPRRRSMLDSDEDSEDDS
jgi:hypothetical protein